MTKTKSGKQIGFDENTADPVCQNLRGPQVGPPFDVWKTLCDRAGIEVSQWIRDQVQSNVQKRAAKQPLQDQELVIPRAQTNPGFTTPTLTNLQSKMIADALFYFHRNSQAIETGFGTRYPVNRFPDIIPQFERMLVNNFINPPGSPMSSRVHALLKNKVYTCNALNGGRIVSTDTDISFTRTDGTTHRMEAGDPCQFGSEYAEFTFKDNTPHTNSLCGPSNIFCDAIDNRCYTQCNCDKWPNAYENIYPHISNARYANPDGTFRIKYSPMWRDLNNKNDGSYRVCAANDYLDTGVPRDSSSSDCVRNCNCNYTCALAQAGARYAGCYPDQFSPSPVRRDFPPYCTSTEEGECDGTARCDVRQYSCITPH